jgi:hypothetical protein
MAYLYAYCDESGKYKEQSIVSYSAIVDSMEPWIAFSNKWVQLLRLHEIPALHAVNALRHSRPFGKFPKCTPEERAAQIAPFIQEITSGLALAVSISVDVDAYRRSKTLHKSFGKDPHYFAFFMVVTAILKYFAIPNPNTVGLICDDDQQKAIRCYRLLNKMKLSIPEVKERVTSICFSDHRGAPQVQTADLFSYLSRLEAMRIFAAKPYAYQSLFNSFGNVSSTGQHLNLDTRFYADNALRAHAEGRDEAFRTSLRVRLPGGIPVKK